MTVEEALEKIMEYIDPVKETETVDLVVSTGGVSVGKKDIMHEVLRAPEAKTVIRKVKMKPGSPLLFGIWRKTQDEYVPAICLSGNPYAAFVNMEILLRPALAGLAGKGGKTDGGYDTSLSKTGCYFI